MTPLEEIIIRSEILLKIRVTGKKLNSLFNESFPTVGPKKIIQLSIKILDIINKQYDQYTIDQLIFIKTGVLDFIIQLISQIEYSTMKKVTWSIIPAYDMLFKTLLTDTEYIIVPQWEENYGILNYNIIDQFKTFLLTPNLIFIADSIPEIEEKVSVILDGVPSKIYLIMYSRLEKLSALHLALLGHEIGHIFASKWIVETFNDFKKETDLINRLKALIEEETKKTGLDFDMFKDYYIKQEIEKYNRIIIKNYCELLSDLFGCALFGHTYIIATYLYSSISSDIEKSHWERGYLSWKFRLQNCERFLNYINTKNKPDIAQDFTLYTNIQTAIRGAISDSTEHPICSLLIEAYRSQEDKIFGVICTYSSDELFTKMLKNEEIEAAKLRLENDIIPNAMMKAGIEIPIDIRNILYALWLVCYRKTDQDIQLYSDSIQFYNLLGIKGIELSVEQRKYNDFVKRPAN